MRFEVSLTLQDLFDIAFYFSVREGTCFFYSGGNFDSAERSFLCLFPVEKIEISCQNNVYPWETLQQALYGFQPNSEDIPLWTGFLGYEMGCFVDREVKIPYRSGKLPDACFYRHALIVAYNHLSKQTQVYINEEASIIYPQDQDNLNELKDQRTWKSFTKRKASKEKVAFTVSLVGQSDTKKNYFEKINAIKNSIAQGDIYQLNLSQEFIFDTNMKDSFQIFAKTAFLNPTPFSCFLNCGNFHLICSSPERLIRKSQNLLETRPIKGTYPRAVNPVEDQENKTKLLQSEKERAELLMITDLMRNDLSIISQPGTVAVKDLWRCEAYSNVYHLLSIIQSSPLSDLKSVTQLRALFPGGSITGCPKLKAMGLIADLEDRPRGIYTGSIGFFTGQGNYDFNIAIRTLCFFPKEKKLNLQLGGGIVFDSDPQKEYEETLHKGRTLFKVLGFELPNFN